MDGVLQILAISFLPAAIAVERADAGHIEAAADLDVIAARKFLVLRIPKPPRNVEMHAAHAVGVVARQSVQRGNMRFQAIADAIGQVAADVAGAVRESVGISAADFELSSRRADSQAPQATTTLRQRICFSVRVVLSI